MLINTIYKLAYALEIVYTNGELSNLGITTPMSFSVCRTLRLRRTVPMLIPNGHTNTSLRQLIQEFDCVMSPIAGETQPG